MKVERIYVIFNDDCHEYLIDYEYYNAFEDEYDNICDLLRSNDIDGDDDNVRYSVEQPIFGYVQLTSEDNMRGRLSKRTLELFENYFDSK